jgi:hypothetical protein
MQWILCHQRQKWHPAKLLRLLHMGIQPLVTIVILEWLPSNSVLISGVGLHIDN